MIAVLIGRFSPLHIGHQMIIDYMIKKYGVENCLILIGSSNSISDRTPYTYEERLLMIHTINPKLKVLPLPDVEPGLEYFNDGTNDVWLDSVEKIVKEFGDEFVFYGGSVKDLEILSLRFNTKVAIDRNTGGKGISATKIREGISNNNFNDVKNLVDKKLITRLVH